MRACTALYVPTQAWVARRISERPRAPFMTYTTRLRLRRLQGGTGRATRAIARGARAPACDLAPCSSPAPMRPRDPARRTARKCRGPRPPQLAELDQLMSLVSSTYIPTGKVCRVESKAARPYVGGNQTVLVRVRAQISTCLRARCALWTRGRGRRRAPTSPPPSPPRRFRSHASSTAGPSARSTRPSTTEVLAAATRVERSRAGQSWAERQERNRDQGQVRRTRRRAPRAPRSGAAAGFIRGAALQVEGGAGAGAAARCSTDPAWPRKLRQQTLPPRQRRLGKLRPRK